MNHDADLFQRQQTCYWSCRLLWFLLGVINNPDHFYALSAGLQQSNTSPDRIWIAQIQEIGCRALWQEIFHFMIIYAQCSFKLKLLYMYVYIICTLKFPNLQIFFFTYNWFINYALKWRSGACSWGLLGIWVGYKYWEGQFNAFIMD